MIKGQKRKGKQFQTNTQLFNIKKEETENSIDNLPVIY